MCAGLGISVSTRLCPVGEYVCLWSGSVCCVHCVFRTYLSSCGTVCSFSFLKKQDVRALHMYELIFIRVSVHLCIYVSLSVHHCLYLCHCVYMCVSVFTTCEYLLVFSFCVTTYMYWKHFPGGNFLVQIINIDQVRYFQNPITKSVPVNRQWLHFMLCRHAVLYSTLHNAPSLPMCLAI